MSLDDLAVVKQHYPSTSMDKPLVIDASGYRVFVDSEAMLAWDEGQPRWTLASDMYFETNGHRLTVLQRLPPSRHTRFIEAGHVALAKRRGRP